jgi:hypothetical protein
MMDQQTVNIILGTVMSVFGWFARELWTAVKQLKDDLAELPKVYLARSDYKDDMREVKEMLGKIFDRLDHKADKP